MAETAFAPSGRPAMPVARMDFSYWNGWPVLAKWGGDLVLGLTYFPLFWLALMSISERPLSGIPFPLSFANYRALAADFQWLPPLLGSLLIAAIVAVTCMIVATMVGRAIPHMRHPGLAVLIVVLPLFVPGMS